MHMASRSKHITNKKNDDAVASNRKKHWLKVSVWAIVILLSLNVFTGIVSYTLTFAWCMHPPITASKFAASYTYFRPGQAYYGPHAFGEYYCSEQDAQNAGFHSSPLQD